MDIELLEKTIGAVGVISGIIITILGEEKVSKYKLLVWQICCLLWVLQ